MLSATEKITKIDVLVLILTACSLGYIVGPGMAFQDLSIYWMASSRWLHGESVYTLPYQLEYISGWGSADPSHGRTLGVWTLPFFLATSSIFFGGWSLPTAKIIYLSLSLLSVGAFALFSYLVLESTLDGYSRISRAILSIISVACLLPLDPLASLLGWGGMGVLSAIAFAILCNARIRGIKTWIVCMALFSLKPHPCALAVLGWFALAHRTEQVSMTRAFVIALALVSVPVAIQPSLLTEFLDTSFALPRGYQQDTTTLTGILLCLGYPAVVGTTISLLVMALVVLSLHQHRANFQSDEIPHLIMLLSPLSVFLSPYAWPHDFIISMGWPGAIFVLKLHLRPIGIVSLLILPCANLLTLFGYFREVSIFAYSTWAIISLSLFITTIRSRSSSS